MLKVTIRSALAHKARLFLSLVAVTLGVAFVAGAFTFTDMMNRSFEDIASSTSADINVTANAAGASASTGASAGTGAPDGTGAPAGTGAPTASTMNGEHGAPSGTSESLAATGGTTVSNPSADASVPANGAHSAIITDGMLEKLRGIDGVKQVAGIVSGSVYGIGKDGKAILSMGPPSVGSNYFDAPAWGNKQGITVIAGRSPKAFGEVAIDPTMLERSGYQLGDSMRFTDGSRTVTKKLVGTAKWGAGGTSGALYVFFTDQGARDLFMPDGSSGYQSAWIVASDPAATKALLQRVKAEIPSTFTVKTGAEISGSLMSEVNKAMGFFTAFFLVFAVISLLVAAVLIVNTFAIIVQQQVRELALYRVLGAYRRQVRHLITGEAFIVGLIGSVIGLFGGLAISSLIVVVIGKVGFDLGSAVPRLTTPAVISAFVVGVGVTVLSALVPSVRAARVDPVVALAGHAGEAPKAQRGRWIATLVLCVLGALALGISFGLNNSMSLVILGVAALLLVIGTCVGSPIIGRPIVGVVGVIAEKLHGTAGYLAKLNSVRQPQRTAATATALMIGMALVTTLGIVGASMSASLRPGVEKSLDVDAAVTIASGVMGMSVATVPDSITAQITQLPEVKSVTALKMVTLLTTQGDYELGATFDPGAFNDAVKFNMVQGRVYKDPNEAVIVKSYAEEKGYRVGDKIHVTTILGTGGRDLTVVGIAEYPTTAFTLGNLFVTPNVVHEMMPTDRSYMVFVRAQQGTNIDQLVRDMKALVKDYPLIGVLSMEDIVEQGSAGVNMMLALMYGLLALAVIIAFLGIVNTMLLSILERTSEIGMLRVVGMRRKDVRRMVRDESLIIALIGSLLGMFLGVLFGVALWYFSADSGLEVLVIPWPLLVGALAIAVVVGILAGVWPASRAARLNVLEAIQTE